MTVADSVMSSSWINGDERVVSEGLAVIEGMLREAEQAPSPDVTHLLLLKAQHRLHEVEDRVAEALYSTCLIS